MFTDCPSLLPLPNNSHANTISAQVGTVVHYSCDTGYHIDVPNPRVCDIGGVWSAPSPTCKGEYTGKHVIDGCGHLNVPVNVYTHHEINAIGRGVVSITGI